MSDDKLGLERGMSEFHAAADQHLDNLETTLGYAFEALQKKQLRKAARWIADAMSTSDALNKLWAEAEERNRREAEGGGDAHD